MVTTCSKCDSQNTSSSWDKVGTYVSYYTVLCLQCGHRESYKITDPL